MALFQGVVNMSVSGPRRPGVPSQNTKRPPTVIPKQYSTTLQSQSPAQSKKKEDQLFSFFDEFAISNQSKNIQASQNLIGPLTHALDTQTDHHEEFGKPKDSNFADHKAEEKSNLQFSKFDLSNGTKTENLLVDFSTEEPNSQTKDIQQSSPFMSMVDNTNEITKVNYQPSPINVLKPSPILATQKTLGEDFDISNLVSTPLIQSEIIPFRRSQAKNQVIAQDMYLTITYLKIWKDNSTSVIIFTCNKTDKTLNRLEIHLTLPQTLEATLSGDSAAIFTENTATLSSLPPRTCFITIVSVKFKKHDFNPILGGQLTYNTGHSKEQRQLIFKIPIELSDLIRPAKDLTESSYPGYWRSHEREDKFTVRNNDKPVQRVVELLAAHNIHTVSIKGRQIISGGKLLGTPNLCLLHCRVEPTFVDVKVRSSDTFFSQVGARYFQRILQ
eukprot:TRINITY_DN4596_c0_g3_i2.p1 TRINITY_DN4596_c0_g3~~TRINITY_DN4596_c0_g3_i2.p1  ORF type:complete len:443 (-),score=72.03 TRINITY_DN4596_c0_g3_i2:59-1387(-)